MRSRKTKKIVVGAFYRPPNSNVDVMDAFSNTLKSIAENQKDGMIIVGGDFNLPSFNWENLCLVRGGSDREYCEAFIDALSSNSLEQLVKRPTRGNNILDIFATNSPKRILRISMGDGISDHKVIHAEMNIKIERNVKPPQFIFILNKGDYDAFR